MSELEKKEKMSEAEVKREKLHNLLDWVVYILIVAVLAFLLLNYVAQRVLVDGTSMNPTLQDQDSVLV